MKGINDATDKLKAVIRKPRVPASCACTMVKMYAMENVDGTLSDEWYCEDCGAEFLKATPVRREITGYRLEINNLKIDVEMSNEKLQDEKDATHAWRKKLSESL